jgi:hypothetical protein
MNSVGKWIAANPQLVSGTIQVIGALLAFKMATIGLKLGLNLLISPFVNVWKNAVLLRANWLRLTLALGEGGKLRWLVTGFSAVARGARTLGGVLRWAGSRHYDRRACRSLDWPGTADESHWSCYHRRRGGGLSYLS